MAYLPIEDYGLIGDMHSVALVGKNGSIDWFCFPYFDSPSVFGRILDAKKGGFYQICPAEGEVTRKQLYLPETNVLITRFFCEHGVGEITDFMPVYKHPIKRSRTIIRQVKAVRGSVKFRVTCNPRFDYARGESIIDFKNEGVHFSHQDSNLFLTSPIRLRQKNKGVFGEFELKQGEQLDFILKACEGEIGTTPWMTQAEAERACQKTTDYWRAWISKSKYRGRWREMVDRSAFVLKLLTFEPTGAILAAATTSLPEGVKGERNWDYRYSWIRDSAFTVYAFLRIGFVDEAAKFMSWVEERCREIDTGDSLQIMYGIDGRHELKEETLDHLEGYKKSKPVRIGNAAYNQKQLDIYGELLDAVYLFNKNGTPISYDFWKYIQTLVDWVCENWNTTDEGVWEVRGGARHFVYSKLMCWVALDRAIRLSEKRSFPCDRIRWLSVRDEIFNSIMDNGWSKERQAFAQSYGSSNLDASNLMMPLTFFAAPNDPRVLKTIDAIMKDPSEGGLVANSLVYRYNTIETNDGLSGEEGTFNICTFWLVEALTRAGESDPKYLEEARRIFGKMLGYANHVGLYAEQIGDHGEALGNFPQAFTHLALISAAYNLDKALGE